MGTAFLDIHTSFGDWKWQVGLSGCLDSSAHILPLQIPCPPNTGAGKEREPSYSEPHRGRRQSGERAPQNGENQLTLEVSSSSHLQASTALVFLGQVSPRRQMYSRWVSVAPSHFRTGLFSV